jgi:hypothetical protein
MGWCGYVSNLALAVGIVVDFNNENAHIIGKLLWNRHRELHIVATIRESYYGHVKQICQESKTTIQLNEGCWCDQQNSLHTCFASPDFKWDVLKEWDTQNWDNLLIYFNIENPSTTVLTDCGGDEPHFAPYSENYNIFIKSIDQLKCNFEQVGIDTNDIKIFNTHIDTFYDSY